MYAILVAKLGRDVTRLIGEYNLPEWQSHESVLISLDHHRYFHDIKEGIYDVRPRPVIFGLESKNDSSREDGTYDIYYLDAEAADGMISVIDNVLTDKGLLNYIMRNYSEYFTKYIKCTKLDPNLQLPLPSPPMPNYPIPWQVNYYIEHGYMPL